MTETWLDLGCGSLKEAKCSAKSNKNVNFSPRSPRLQDSAAEAARIVLATPEEEEEACKQNAQLRNQWEGKFVVFVVKLFCARFLNIYESSRVEARINEIKISTRCLIN